MEASFALRDVFCFFSKVLLAPGDGKSNIGEIERVVEDVTFLARLFLFDLFVLFLFHFADLLLPSEAHHYSPRKMENNRNDYENVFRKRLHYFVALSSEDFSFSVRRKLGWNYQKKRFSKMF